MAEFNSPEEIKEYLEDTARIFGKNSEEYVNAMKDAEAGIKGYTANLKNSMSQLGTSFKALGADMYKGTKGVGQFGGAIETGAQFVKAYSDKFSVAGRALANFTIVVAKFASASLKMSDQLYSSYEKISRAGVVGSGAMSEVYDNLRNFGYTIDELNNLGELLAKNSKNFGLFFQSALQGSREFSKVASTIQNSGLREQFFRMGMSVDDINDGIAGYIAQQGKLGRIQGQTTDQLARGAEAYIKELDLMTKLTGLTRQEQEDIREQALQIETFYAGLEDLDPKQAEQALQYFTQVYAKGGPKAAAEVASYFNGAITGATDLLQVTGAASMRAGSKEFFAKGGTAAEAFQMLKDNISPAMMDTVKSVQQFGGSFGPPLRTLNMLTKDGLDPMSDRIRKLIEEQKDQIAGVDSATKSQARARDNQIKTAQNLQDFVRLGVGPATKALQIFTEAIEYLTGFIPGFESKEKKAARAAAAAAGSRSAGGTDAGGTMGGTEVPTAGAASSTDLSGLPIKKGATSGGEHTEALASLAHRIYKELGGEIVQFTGLNDSYGRDPNSKHPAGRALDFTIKDATQSARIADLVRGMPGVSYVQDEYLNPSPRSTGNHIHAEVSAAAGAILSGPMSGYQPNLTMHGTEAIVPLNTPAQQAAAGMGDNSILVAQLDRLDELISVMKNQLSVSTKIMQYSH